MTVNRCEPKTSFKTRVQLALSNHYLSSFSFSSLPLSANHKNKGWNYFCSQKLFLICRHAYWERKKIRVRQLKSVLNTSDHFQCSFTLIFGARLMNLQSLPPNQPSRHLRQIYQLAGFGTTQFKQYFRSKRWNLNEKKAIIGSKNQN